MRNNANLHWKPPSTTRFGVPTLFRVLFHRRYFTRSVNFHQKGCSLRLVKLVVAEMCEATRGTGEALEQVLKA